MSTEAFTTNAYSIAAGDTFTMKDSRTGTTYTAVNAPIRDQFSISNGIKILVTEHGDATGEEFWKLCSPTDLVNIH